MAKRETSKAQSFFGAPSGEKIKVGDSLSVNQLQHGNFTKYFARVERIGDKRKEVGPSIKIKSKEVKLRRYCTPEETIAGRLKFYGKKELLLTDRFDTIDPDMSFVRLIHVHSILDYTKLKLVDKFDYFSRFEYNTQEGWLSPATVSVFCKCKIPFNPDLYMLKCEACKEQYHPDCMNMTIDEAMQLADNFTCSDCLKPDKQDSSSATVGPSVVGHKRARRS